MVLYPEVQRRAQAEIDRIIGTDRLPTFDDIDNLPYLGAIYKETLRQVIVELTPDFHFPLNYMSRWQPVVPLGMYSDTKLHMFVKLKNLFRSTTRPYSRRHIRWLLYTERYNRLSQCLVSVLLWVRWG